MMTHTTAGWTTSPRSLVNSPATEQIPESSIRTFTEGYLGAGETVFNFIAGQAVTSQYFKKE